MEKDSNKEDSAKTQSSHSHHHHHKKDNVNNVVHVCIHQKFIITNWQLPFSFIYFIISLSHLV